MGYQVNLISRDAGLHCDVYYFFYSLSSPSLCVFGDDCVTVTWEQMIFQVVLVMLIVGMGASD